jgi:hypothetical protein
VNFASKATIAAAAGHYLASASRKVEKEKEPEKLLFFWLTAHDFS